MRRANDKTLDAAKRIKAAARRERKLAGERRRKNHVARYDLSADMEDIEDIETILDRERDDWRERWAAYENRPSWEASDWKEYWAMEKGERDRLRKCMRAEAQAMERSYSAFCEHERQVSDALGRVRDANRRPR